MNDFKRMWTKEELEKLVKESGGVEVITFNQTISDGDIINITKEMYETLIKREYKVIVFNFYNNIIHCVSYAGKDGGHAYYQGADNNENIIIVDVHSSYDPYPHEVWRMKVNITKYTTETAFEDLVKSTPTSVSIIEDQGKLELMLEHDGEVLEVNDTPNQFLQRRLDKPSAEWNSETSETDLASWLEEHNLYERQVVFIRHADDSGYYYVSNSENKYMFIPLSISTVWIADTDELKICLSLSINTTTNELDLDYIGGKKQTTILDIDMFKLF